MAMSSPHFPAQIAASNLRPNNCRQKKEAMKLRHAAALALVGWYLMTPPFVNNRADLNTPLSRWTILGSFDSAEKCEEDRRPLQGAGSAWHEPDPNHAAKALTAILCVSSDDPRLKRN